MRPALGILNVLRAQKLGASRQSREGAPIKRICTDGLPAPFRVRMFASMWRFEDVEVNGKCRLARRDVVKTRIGIIAVVDRNYDYVAEGRARTQRCTALRLGSSSTQRPI